MSFFLNICFDVAIISKGNQFKQISYEINNETVKTVTT